MKHLDRDAISDAVVAAVRSALPADFMRPKPRRWPFVAVSLLVAAVFATVFLVRRPLTATIGVAPADLRRYVAQPVHDADQALSSDAEPVPALGS